MIIKNVIGVMVNIHVCVYDFCIYIYMFPFYY